MNLTMDDILAIVKPEHDRIIAEAKARSLEAENAKLRAQRAVMLSVLLDLEEFLIDLADADDGLPNDAMRHLVDLRAAIAKAEGLP